MYSEINSIQRKKVQDKYAHEEEFRFWTAFVEKGLTRYEETALSERLTKEARVLDVGCGCGREALAITGMGFQVCGFDVVRQNAEAAKVLLERHGRPARIVCADLHEGIPFSGDFDAALLFEQVYQHIPSRPDRLRALRNIRRCLTRDGLLFLAAINEGDISLKNRFLWLSATGWALPRNIVLRGVNPLHSRYLDGNPEPGEEDMGDLSWRKRLRLVRWVLAYFYHLARRKFRIRWRRFRTGEAERKTVTRNNPVTDSPGDFLFEVLSFEELEAELTEAGLEIVDVHALMDDAHKLSASALRGAPLVLVVARSSRISCRNGETECRDTSHCSVFTTWSDLEHLRDDWDRLWPLNPECNREFYAFDWMVYEAQQTDARPCVFVLRQNNETTEIAPLAFRTFRHPQFKLSFRTISFFPNVWIFRHGFLGKNMSPDLPRAVVASMNTEQRADLLVLNGMEKEEAERLFGVALEGRLPCSLLQVNAARGGYPGTASADRCIVCLTESWEGFLAQRGRNYRKKLRHRSHVANARGHVALWREVKNQRLCGDAWTSERIVETILHVEHKAWQETAGVHLGKRGYDRLLRSIEIARQAGSLDVAFLLLDGRPVAYHLGLVFGRFARSCFQAYDRDVADISPGILLQAAIIRTSIEQTDLVEIDLGGSRHENKHQLAERKDCGYELTVYGNSWRAKLLYYARRIFSRWHRFHAPE